MATNDKKWQEVYELAHIAGMKAGYHCLPTPMTVNQLSNPIDDKSEVEKSWFVPEGVAGFAWVTIHPGNHSFARWLAKNRLASKAYRGGMQIWVHEFGQSMQRKEAYAEAFAKVINSYRITAYAGSRMD